MTGYGAQMPRAGSQRRLEVEQAIARGVSNSRVMLHYSLSYEQLRAVIESMDEENGTRLPTRKGRRSSHGTEAAWRTHGRKKEPRCDECVQAHAESIRLRSESRARALIEKRMRGVA